MTAANFRDLLDPIEHFKAGDGMWSTRILDADDLLARPVPWVDCPTCKGEVLLPGKFGVDPLGLKLCPACHGTGKATVAQLLAWGSAVAQDLTSEWRDHDFPFEAVDDYRHRILDVQPGRVS